MEVCSVFPKLCYENKDRLLAGIIVAGYDKEKGGQVYSVPIGGSLVQQPFSIGGSGSSFIYGYCDAHYKDSFTREECEAFVVTALSLAMSRDGSSGGVIRTCTINADGVSRNMYPGNALRSFGDQAW